ncbi:MAG TPA: hypothetical protein VNA89_05240 [Gemmatimonadaceae bacterium]|nr:hypothetical protein [Gemmatimonadaceae bacterium]
MSETRARFLRAIVEQLAAREIAELHLFPPLRQGGVESGVAVVAVAPGAGEALGAAVEAAALTGDSGAVAAVAGAAPRPEHGQAPPPVAARHTIYTARYREALKGPDRGKWEFDIVPEADAPLATVEAVVRGVQRRVGDGGEPERVPADAVRALVAEAACRGAK